MLLAMFLFFRPLQPRCSYKIRLNKKKVYSLRHFRRDVQHFGDGGDAFRMLSESGREAARSASGSEDDVARLPAFRRRRRRSRPRTQRNSRNSRFVDGATENPSNPLQIPARWQRYG